MSHSCLRCLVPSCPTPVPSSPPHPYLLGITLEMQTAHSEKIVPSSPFLPSSHALPTAVLGITLQMETAHPQKLVGIALAVAGAICMVLGGVSSSTHHAHGKEASNMLLGNLCLVVNTAAMAVYYVVSKQVGADGLRGPLSLLNANMECCQQQAVSNMLGSMGLGACNAAQLSTPAAPYSAAESTPLSAFALPTRRTPTPQAVAKYPAISVAAWAYLAGGWRQARLHVAFQHSRTGGRAGSLDCRWWCSWCSRPGAVLLVPLEKLHVLLWLLLAAPAPCRRCCSPPSLLPPPAA